MKQKLKWDEKIGILFFAAAILMLGISVYLCFCEDIWYDELFTMEMAGRSFGEMVSLTARDVHPPLYYGVVRLFLLGAGGEFVRQVIAAKLASVLPFLLCLILAGTKIRKHFGLFCAGFFSFLLVSMPQLSQYMVEVRMYGYTLFFVTAAMICGYEIWENQESGTPQYLRFAVLTLCGLAACYTHYFACVAVVMIYLVLFATFIWKKTLKKNGLLFLASGIICSLGYLPWLLVVVREQVAKVSENYWIQPVSLRTLGGCVKFIFLPAFSRQSWNVVLAVLCLFIYAGVFVFCAFRTIKGKKESDRKILFLAVSCMVSLTGLVLFGIAVSLLMRPIFVYRYMLPALGVFWLAFAGMVSTLKEKKRWIVPVLVLFALVGLRNFRAFYGEEMWKRVQMEQTREAFAQIEAEDLLIFNFDQTQAVVSAYLPNETYLWYGSPETLIQEMLPQNHALVEADFTDEAGIGQLQKFLSEGKSLWYLGSGNVREEILEKWSEAGISSTERGSVMLERYWFNLYKLE